MERAAARGWVAVFVIALVVSSCGGGNDEPRKTAESGGFATYEVKSAAFSVSVPADWTTATPDDLDEEVLDAYAKENPEIAQFVEVISQPNSPIKLFAFDPEVSAGFATNLNVIVETVPDGISAEEYFEANVAQIEQLVEPDGIRKERVRLSAREALHLTYEHRLTGRALAADQYVLFGDGRGYVLTYTTVAARAERYAAEFARSARSFRIG